MKLLWAALAVLLSTSAVLAQPANNEAVSQFSAGGALQNNSGQVSQFSSGAVITNSQGMVSQFSAGAVIYSACLQPGAACNAKLINNIVIGAPSTAQSNNKQLINVVTNTANAANNKLLVNIVVIPGAASTGIVPVSPLTHFR